MRDAVDRGWYRSNETAVTRTPVVRQTRTSHRGRDQDRIHI